MQTWFSKIRSWTPVNKQVCILSRDSLANRLGSHLSGSGLLGSVLLYAETISEYVLKLQVGILVCDSGADEESSKTSACYTMSRDHTWIL